MAETTHLYDDFALKMTRGDEVKLSLAVTKTQGGVTSAQDLTGGVVWVTGKRSLNDANTAAVIRLNSSALGGVEILSAAAGTAEATIAEGLTEDLPTTLQGVPLCVDCVWVDDAGKSHTFQKGRLTIYPDAEL